jgi:succinyl-diaminopimelate desuccinylase
VPLGEAEWTREPLGGEVDGDRLYGRGASDMKAGLAGIVTAAERLAALGTGDPGLEVVLCAGEETGCAGARRLVDSGALGDAGAGLVAEPTSNYPCVAHKGVVWLDASTSGRSAHGSMPHLGDNAVYKLARAVAALEDFRFDGHEHPLLGSATLSVGTIAGGVNINSVPDRAVAGIDVRPVPGLEGAEVEERLAGLLGAEVRVTRRLDLSPVATDPGDAWVREVFDIMEPLIGGPSPAGSPTSRTPPR